MYTYRVFLQKYLLHVLCFMALLSRLASGAIFFCDWHLHNLDTMTSVKVLYFQGCSYHRDIV